MTSSTFPEKLFVRLSHADDIARIVAFYQDNPSPYVFPREFEVWKERAAAGAVTLIEDREGHIVASSVSYPIAVEGAHRWTEVGSTLVALRGAGLFKTLLQAQAVAASLHAPPPEGFVLEIVRSNARSIEVFEKAGSERFEVPEDLFRVVQKTFTPESQKRDVQWYRITPEKARAMARELLETERAPRLRGKETGLEYALDFSRFQPLREFRREVSRWAGEDIARLRAAALRFRGPGL
jgi:hypothetical protein